MKLSTKLLTLALVIAPAVPAAIVAQTAALAAPTPVTVARYTFDKGFVSGRVAENTGRGVPLSIKSVAGGAITISTSSNGNRYVRFPGKCATTSTSCPRAFFEGGDDADLDPGTRQFRYGALVLVSKAQLKNSSNVVQKGVVSTESQWKMQIGSTLGKAQCVVVGRGSTQAYVVRSTTSVADSKWHRIMCMRTSTGLYIFVDGTRRGRVTIPATVSISNNLPLRIGGPNLTPTSDMYNGWVDDVFVTLG